MKPFSVSFTSVNNSQPKQNRYFNEKLENWNLIFVKSTENCKSVHTENKIVLEKTAQEAIDYGMNFWAKDMAQYITYQCLPTVHIDEKNLMIFFSAKQTE